MSDNVISLVAIVLLVGGSIVAGKSLERMICMGIHAIFGKDISFNSFLVAAFLASFAMLLLKTGLYLCPGFSWLIKVSLAAFAVFSVVRLIRIRITVIDISDEES